MKLNVNYRTKKFIPSVRIAPAPPRDEQLRRLRQVVESEFPHLHESRGQLVKLALNEAEALAWQTPYPHLVFPALAHEKVSAVAAWHKRQAALQRQELTVAFAE
ncbi:MAG: hypothetical protein HY300_07160 [Verrucomicrobia bacterium]|nr:hypothetical protein [Verrucomicrobiota bacterium]